MLTRGCNERCSFCYAGDYFAQSPPARADAVLAGLERYAALVAEAPPLPEWDDTLPELARTLFSSRVVNLLGGEPTLHPSFVEVVEAAHGHGLGVIVFTNASRPERIQAVADKLWNVTVNGHFAARAPALGFPMERVFANLPVRRGEDILARLAVIRDAGIRVVFLAFATPVGGADPSCYTPDDEPEMRALHGEALAFCEANGIFLGYDCSFPLCVDERVAQTKCTSVPVMDAAGFMSICGGEYYMASGRRHIADFESLQGLHDYTYRLISGLRALPSQFEKCNTCPEFNKRCHGMCLAYREKPSARLAL
ncbi:MAG: radical SAM protein [Alphaproteobacteria bacterium]|nr:radical SAM protein [Alphaproteobacteria bacterium]